MLDRRGARPQAWPVRSLAAKDDVPAERRDELERGASFLVTALSRATVYAVSTRDHLFASVCALLFYKGASRIAAMLSFFPAPGDHEDLLRRELMPPVTSYCVDTSVISRALDISQGNYRFGYDVVHSSGSSFHKEESTNGVKVGSYGLRDVDGRVRIVNYVADAQGFRADVQTNEPAVDPVKDSATTGQAVPSVDLMAVNASSGEDTAVVGPTEIPAASSTMVSSSVSVEPSGYPERAGGDVVPPKVLIDAADDVPRRTKPRPPVFPPPKEVDAPRRPGPPKRTTLRYPFYVDAADVHVVGPVPPAFPPQRLSA
ncbi:hypothetical protein HPB51_004619 [Rhipicephalus microplus]|uniref:Uncharacterized protein n=1 Tax=Rhipicephalus microplus TaxID=6941 RepID=A0A9J6ELZ1_RHIMP|nr:hypothetical protein HPB51_004619 [Rhipicephalus microplus]